MNYLNEITDLLKLHEFRLSGKEYNILHKMN